MVASTSCISEPVLHEEDELEVLSPDLPNILQNEMVARKLSQQDNTRGIGFGRSKRLTRHRKESTIVRGTSTAGPTVETGVKYKV